MGTCEVLEWDRSSSPPSQEGWKIPVLAGQPGLGWSSRVPGAQPGGALLSRPLPPPAGGGGGCVCVRPGGDALAARARRQPRSQQREKRPFPCSLFLVKCLETDCSLGYISAPRSRLSLKIEAFAYLSTRPPSCTQEGRLSGSSVTQLSPVVQWLRVLEQRNQSSASQAPGGLWGLRVRCSLGEPRPPSPILHLSIGMNRQEPPPCAWPQPLPSHLECASRTCCHTSPNPLVPP